MLTIRSFADADYVSMVAIDTATYPYPLGLETWKHIDSSRDPGFMFCRDMIERDGQVVGFGEYGQLPWMYHPDKYHFYVLVDPDHESSDIRPFYYAYVMDRLAQYHPLAITSAMLENKEPHTGFLREVGFCEVMRTQLSELDVTAFDPAPFAPFVAKVAAAQIQIVTLRDLMQRDPNWKAALYDLEWALVQDIPSPEPAVRSSLEVFEDSMLNGPNTLLDGWFVALDGSSYVGTSRAYRNPVNTDQLDGSLTGVIRSHRRRGIATVLKLHLIEFARQYGAAIILTANEENNPMYHLNLTLGFKPRPAWITYEKSLAAVS